MDSKYHLAIYEPVISNSRLPRDMIAALIYMLEDVAVYTTNLVRDDTGIADKILDVIRSVSDSNRDVEEQPIYVVTEVPERVNRRWLYVVAMPRDEAESAVEYVKSEFKIINGDYTAFLIGNIKLNS